MSESADIAPIEVEATPAAVLTLPTGEIVDLSDPSSCARALTAVREIEMQVRGVKDAIIETLSDEAKRRGENTIELEDGTRIEVKRNYEIAWDHQQLEDELREAGMPEERIREIIVEEVSYSVKAVEANRASKANPTYAEAIEKARTRTEKRPTISLPRG